MTICTIILHVSCFVTKPTKWPVHPVWSESLLCTQWVAKDSSSLHADSEDWSDWADAQADMSRRWAHMPLSWFCHEAAHVCMILCALICLCILFYIIFIPPAYEGVCCFQVVRQSVISSITLFVFSVVWEWHVLTRFRLGSLCVNFCQFVIELLPLIDVRIWFLLNILRTKWCRFWPKFAYALIQARSRLALLHFCIFTIELWPLIDARIAFLLNILRMKWLFSPNFAYASMLGLLHVNFYKFINELWPLINVRIHFRSISWEQFDGFWPDFAFILLALS